MTSSNATDSQDSRKAIHFSSVLNKVIYLEKVQSLDDRELVLLSEELTHVSASIKAHFLHLEKRFELDYDLDDSQLIRAKKKYYYIKKFVVEVEREREKRFQLAQGISFSAEETRKAMNLLRDRRRNLYLYAMDVETQAALIDLLRKEIGSERADKLVTEAKVYANQKLAKEPILNKND